ncbi:MAG: hypothetical protein F4029_15595 [Gammaproteobacteria bacterium]|nr:hypothetical protein [Gammaproteobacteria bacterium]MYF28452.1 hypothetical protein [Gammaproteobacteria bacterium]MYK47640.1 hypothetical protein [Gammaproteobacteria bacterium]
MNRLPTAKRAAILRMLVEGSSMRSITRDDGVSINTIAKLLNDAGDAAKAFLNEHVRQIPDRRRIECSQTWAFSHSTAGSRGDRTRDTDDTWTFAAIDADSKLIVSCEVGDNSQTTTAAFLEDVRRRLSETPVLSTNGLKGNHDVADIRMAKRPRSVDTPKSDGSRPQMPSNTEKRRLEKHVAMINLYAFHYNYCRVHPALGMTPAMAAGLDDDMRDMTWLVDLIDKRAGKPNRPKTYRKRVHSN